MLTDSVCGLKMNLLSDYCGQNIEVRNGNTAKWIDITAHIFHSLSYIRPGKYEFNYIGTGHASVGAGRLLADGHVDWIFRVNINCKNEHGNGSIVFSEEGRLSVELQGKEVDFMTSDLQCLYLFFDIRFGKISFSAKDTKLKPLSQDAMAITDNANTTISLCRRNPGAFCVVQNPLTADKDIELLFNVASNPQYWHIKLTLSNSTPESNSYCTSFCYLKKYKNSEGTIRVAMKANGDISCSFKDKFIKANTKNLHLSQPIYLWLELYRCQVEIKSYNVSEKVPMAYININNNQPHTVTVDENHVGLAEYRRPQDENYIPQLQSQIQDFCQQMDDDGNTELKLLLEVNGPQPHTVALDDPMMQGNCVGFAECRRPHEDSYDDVVPVVLKSPRLHSMTHDDEDNTELKVLVDDRDQEIPVDDRDQEIQWLMQMLSLASQMKNTDSRSHYETMFKNIRTTLLERLENLENNHTISDADLVNMRYSIQKNL